MGSFVWFGGSGDLNDPLNWPIQALVIDPVTGLPILSAPGPTDSASIPGGGTLSGSITIENAYVTGTFDLCGNLSGNLVEIDGDLKYFDRRVHIRPRRPGTGRLPYQVELLPVTHSMPTVR